MNNSRGKDILNKIRQNNEVKIESLKIMLDQKLIEAEANPRVISEKIATRYRNFLPSMIFDINNNFKNLKGEKVHVTDYNIEGPEENP